MVSSFEVHGRPRRRRTSEEEALRGAGAEAGQLNLHARRLHWRGNVSCWRREGRCQQSPHSQWYSYSSARSAEARRQSERRKQSTHCIVLVLLLLHDLPKRGVNQKGAHNLRIALCSSCSRSALYSYSSALYSYSVALYFVLQCPGFSELRASSLQLDSYCGLRHCSGLVLRASSLQCWGTLLVLYIALYFVCIVLALQPHCTHCSDIALHALQ